MTYERFEDLPVWRDAIRLAEGCEDFLLAAKEKITFSKRDQLDRCSLSVSNNVAEGFERGSTNELLAFEWEKRTTREADANSFAAREREIISKLSSDDPARRLWEQRNGPL